MARSIRHQRPHRAGHHRSLVLLVPWLCLCFCWTPAFVGSHTKIAQKTSWPVRATADPAVLANAKQVREIQGNGPSGELQWNLYVKTFSDAKGKGSVPLSPGNYDAGFLEDFVSNYNDGYRLSSVAAAVAEGAQFEESGVFRKALDAHLRKQEVTGITAMSEEVAGEFLKICGQQLLQNSKSKKKSRASKASVSSISSSATEVARQVNDAQNSGPSGAKQWALYVNLFAESNSPSSSPSDYDDDFLKDFLDNFNDGYRLSSASAAAAECAQLESSGTFAKAMEDFLRTKGHDAGIHSVSDELALEFFTQCGQVGLDHLDEEIIPETKASRLERPKEVKEDDTLSAKSPPLPAWKEQTKSNKGTTAPGEMPPLPPLPPIEQVKSNQNTSPPQVKSQAADVSKPPAKTAPAPSKPPAPPAPAPKKAPKPSKPPAPAAKTAVEPQAVDAKSKLNEWVHSRLKRKPSLEDMTFGFQLQMVGGKPKYTAQLSFWNRELAPNGDLTFYGTVQDTKRSAIDSAAREALIGLSRA
eukprot:TRINITY_DN63074_c0_g1_i1.p1 TRINITY_DN63074_c0_g1~~TRINITY_DN63074_c0_g1_i1.p1  ORF type:complete len:527 (+),score=116.47 TRINITY_DN63074_c0_g1_i1:47-1627(+)